MPAYGESFRLKIKEKAVFEDGLEVELVDIVTEQIEAAPEPGQPCRERSHSQPHHRESG